MNEKYINAVLDYFNSLKIKSRIIIGFAVVIFLLLIFSLLIIWTINSLSKAQKLTEYSLRAVNNLRMARLNEKDFFDTKDLKFAQKNKKNMMLFNENLKKLINIDKKKEFESKINILLKLGEYYSENFNKIIVLMKKKGLNKNQGIFEEVKKYYSIIETKITQPELLLSFAKLDKYFSIYLQNKNQTMINLFSLESQNFEELLKKYKYDENFYNEFNYYKNNFYGILSFDNQIDGAIEEFVSYINRIEPEIENYTIYINNLVNFAKIRGFIISILMILLLISMVIVVSVITTKGITKPINTISYSTHSIKGVTANLSKIVEKNVGQSLVLIKNIEKVNNLIDNQSNCLGESSQYIIDFTNNLKEIAEIAHNKKKNLEIITDKVHNSKEQIEKLVKFVKMIKENSSIMLETATIISKVADQTKVLAVNSGIEASNAGDYGRVLKIVAKEIKNLSEKTSQNANYISENINKNLRLIENSANQGDYILQNFLNLVIEIENTAISTVEIINKIETISNNTNFVMNYIKNLINITDTVRNSSNHIKTMANGINDNILKLIDVKSDTNEAVNNIIEGINQLTDTDEKRA